MTGREAGGAVCTAPSLGANMCPASSVGNQSIPVQQFVDELFACAAQKFTGRITITSTTGQVAQMWLTSGHLTTTQFPGPQPRLDIRLLSAGLVEPETLHAVLGEHHTGLYGTTVLCGENVNTDTYIHAQIVSHTANLLCWDLAAVEKFGDKHVPELDNPLHIQDVLAESENCLETWKKTTQLLGGPHKAVQLSMRAAPRDTLALNPYSWSVLAKIDGQRDVGTLADMCGLTIYEAAQTVSTLHEMGLVVFPAAQLVDVHTTRRTSHETAHLLRELSSLNCE